MKKSMKDLMNEKQKKTEFEEIKKYAIYQERIQEDHTF